MTRMQGLDHYMRLIYCCECETEKHCEMIKGTKAYPHRKDLHHKNFWQCSGCRNFVGTHHNGEGRQPLGCIPNKAMKNARQHIHALIDPIWKNRILSRSEVYKKLSEKLGYEFHVAELRTIPQARTVWATAAETFKDVMR